MLFRRFKKSIENILIVEDEPLVAFENELRIADAGYRVAATVDNEPEAIALIAQGNIHLVLADVALSNGGSGVSVAEAASAAGIPVLFATGACPINARRFAIGCLIKPYTARELVRAIETVDLLIRGDQPKAMPQALSLYEDDAGTA